MYKVPTMQDEMVMVSGMPIQNGDIPKKTFPQETNMFVRSR